MSGGGRVPVMRGAPATLTAEAIFAAPERVSFDALIQSLTEIGVMVGQAQMDARPGDLRMIGAAVGTATRHAKLLAGRRA